MRILNAFEIKESGFYWEVPESGDGCPVSVFNNGGGFKCLKPGDTRVHQLTGMYIGPLTTPALQGM